MKDRKVKGELVIYVPAGETFTAPDGLRYKAVPDFMQGHSCACCDFWPLKGVCGLYRCVGDDREDGIGVHFVKCRVEQ